MSVKIKVRNGNKQVTYKSLQEASDKTGIPYITLWMRVNKLGWPISTACKADVRNYDQKRVAA